MTICSAPLTPVMRLVCSSVTSFSAAPLANDRPVPATGPVTASIAPSRVSAAKLYTRSRSQHLGDQGSSLFAGQEQQMQAVAPHGSWLARSRNLLLVRPPRTRIGKHVVDLVDGGEQRTASRPSRRASRL